MSFAAPAWMAARRSALGLAPVSEAAGVGADAWIATTELERLVEARLPLRQEAPGHLPGARSIHSIASISKSTLRAAEATELARRAKRRRWTIAAVAVVGAGLSAAAVVSWYQWRSLGQNRLEAKLIEYQEAVKLAERDTLHYYSINSSARCRKDIGIVSPSALAVLGLIAIQNLVGNCTGRSAGFAPRRM